MIAIILLAVGLLLVAVAYAPLSKSTTPQTQRGLCIAAALLALVVLLLQVINM